jgi:four helix bundle protein
METRSTLRNFVAWQKAVTLHADVLRLSLSPAVARHPWLAEGLRGSAQAIAGHLAEGHARTDEFGAEVLYPMAKGICGQLLSQVLAARMAGLLEPAAAEALERQCEEVQRVVAGVLRARREGGGEGVNGARGRAPRRPASDEGSRGGDPWDNRS